MNTVNDLAHADTLPTVTGGTTRTEDPVGYHRELLDLLRELRERAGGPSLRQIARTANASPATLSGLFSGGRVPSPQIASAVAKALCATTVQQAKAGEYAERAAADRSARRTAVSAKQEIRSSYMRHVKDLAPRVLLNRDEEIAELTEFCQREAGPSYAWWRGDAWTGKSALMSWFVLHPPARTRVVSFFITARHPGHHNRGGFVDAVLEQLATILGSTVPTFAVAATREAHLLTMLDEASAHVRRSGLRLVLVVDGLDEDRGVTVGPHAHSIAALLPMHPPDGVKIIVTGRPSPPIPFDVPDLHPLRTPSIARTLTPSLHAGVVRAEMERELRHLLHGSAWERDLLGLLAVAGDGLTGEDLASLTGADAIDVVSSLRAVSGRSFADQASTWRSDKQVFTIGHEELHLEAMRTFGPAKLDAYRGRLHTWASSYEQAKWPASTPEYLLRGYFQLIANTDDLGRALTYAVDMGRHDRMLDLSGGDSAALAEVDAVRGLLLAGEDPDLIAMTRLAVHRDRLLHRNERIPEALPAAWERIGNRSHAQSLARAIVRADRGTEEPLALLAEATARGGDLVEAAGLAEELHSFRRAQTLTNMIWIAAEVEDRAEVGRLITAAREAIADNKYDEEVRAISLANLGTAIARSGDYQGAIEALDGIAEEWEYWYRNAVINIAAICIDQGGQFAAGSLPDALDPTGRDDLPNWAWRQFVCLAGVVGATDRGERALTFIVDPVELCYALASLAESADTSDAARYAAQAEAAVSDVPEKRRDNARLSVARAWISAEDISAATATMIKMGSSRDRECALSLIIRRMAAGSGYDEATDFVNTKLGPYSSSPAAKIALIRSLIGRGETDRAEAMARTLEPDQQAAMLTGLASELAETGARDRATALADEVERWARAAAATDQPAGALVTLAHALFDCGRHDLAVDVVTQLCAALASDDVDVDDGMACLRLVPELVKVGAYDLATAVVAALDPTGSWFSWNMLAHHLSRAEQHERVAELVDAGRVSGIVNLDAFDDRPEDILHARIANVTESDDDSELQAIFQVAGEHEQTDIVRSLAESGRLRQAEALANSLDDPNNRAWALASITRPACEAGDLDTAERVALANPQDHERARALALVAQYFPGDDARMNAAEDAARKVKFAEERTKALEAVVDAMLANNEVDRALTIARSISLVSEQARCLARIAERFESTERRRLLAEALAVARWDASLPWLIEVEPSVLPILAAAVCR